MLFNEGKKIFLLKSKKNLIKKIFLKLIKLKK